MEYDSFFYLPSFCDSGLEASYYYVFVLQQQLSKLEQAQVHKHAHTWREVQQCTLLSIKTGGCSEDCSYCPQSSRYSTGVQPHKLLSEDVVLEAARKVRIAAAPS